MNWVVLFLPTRPFHMPTSRWQHWSWIIHNQDIKHSENGRETHWGEQMEIKDTLFFWKPPPPHLSSLTGCWHRPALSASGSLHFIVMDGTHPDICHFLCCSHSWNLIPLLLFVQLKTSHADTQTEPDNSERSVIQINFISTVDFNMEF